MGGPVTGTVQQASGGGFVSLTVVTAAYDRLQSGELCGTAAWREGEVLEQLYILHAWECFGYTNWASFCVGELGISASTASRHRSAYRQGYEGPLREVRG